MSKIKLNIPFLNQQFDNTKCSEVIKFIKENNPSVDLTCLTCVKAHELLWQAYHINRSKDIESYFKKNEEILKLNEAFYVE